MLGDISRGERGNSGPLRIFSHISHISASISEFVTVFSCYAIKLLTYKNLVR
jgi:hypothetical protein